MRAFLTIIVLLTVVAWCLIREPNNYSSAPQNTANEQGQGRLSRANNYPSDYQKENADKKVTRWYTSPEWVLAVVGIFTFLTIGWQSYETRRSANIAERNSSLMIAKDRAKIMVQANPFLNQPVVAGTPPETYVTYKLWNHGITKAIITSVGTGATVDTSPHPHPTLDVAVPTVIPTVIEGSSIPLDCTAIVFPRQLSDADFAAIADKKLFIRFFGSIDYKDIFNENRNTTFYLLWKPFMGLRNYGRWEKIGPKHANQET